MPASDPTCLEKLIWNNFPWQNKWQAKSQNIKKWKRINWKRSIENETIPPCFELGKEYEGTIFQIRTTVISQHIFFKSFNLNIDQRHKRYYQQDISFYFFEDFFLNDSDGWQENKKHMR